MKVMTIQKTKLISVFKGKEEMNMKHKIRIHSAQMETKYGTDTDFTVDDPASPRNTEDIIDELMGKLNYT